MERHRSSRILEVRWNHAFQHIIPHYFRCFRAVLRLVIIQTTGRPILFPTLPERELDPTSIGESLSSSKASPKVVLDRPPTPDHIKNNRAKFSPAPPKPSQVPSHTKTKDVHQGVDGFLFSKALTPASVSSPTSFIHPLFSVRDWCSELVFILRPLIYGKNKFGEERALEFIQMSFNSIPSVAA